MVKVFRKRNKSKIGMDVLLHGSKIGRVINVHGDRLKVYIFGNGGIHVFNKNEVKFL